LNRFRLRRPSPALVVSIIALVVATTGTGYAAISLPKNSVGTKQLKKNAVTGTKIKKNAVTGSKVKDHSLAGADINLGALGTVPSAANANHATNADNATNATNATHATSADTAGSAQPVAFALVNSNGTVADGKGVTNANVTHPSTGVYCVSGLSFTVRGGQVINVFGGSRGTTAQFTPGTTGFCPSGGQVLTSDNANAAADLTFNVLFYG
jgi:hypothetical protein